MSADHDTAAVLTEVPDDPPGIDPSTHDMPTPSDAAERVNAFVAWFGDGRVFVDPDESTAPPLYTRDLETLTRLVTRTRLAAQPPQDDQDTRAWLCIKCGYGSQEHGMSGHPSFLCVADMALVQVVPTAEPTQAQP